MPATEAFTVSDQTAALRERIAASRTASRQGFDGFRAGQLAAASPAIPPEGLGITLDTENDYVSSPSVPRTPRNRTSEIN
ncbi:MAG: hypothetical protein AB7L92_07575 [Alphaproteobacteria bacterium]